MKTIHRAKSKSKPRPLKHHGTPAAPAALLESGVYHGRQAKTGNSLGFRFDRALFRTHPEFSGKVEARIIGPGRMLVIADPESGRHEEDPVLASFLSFLSADMVRTAQRIKPLDEDLMARIDRLVGGLPTSPEEDLGDEALI